MKKTKTKKNTKATKTTKKTAKAARGAKATKATKAKTAAKTAKKTNLTVVNATPKTSMFDPLPTATPAIDGDEVTDNAFEADGGALVSEGADEIETEFAEESIEEVTDTDTDVV